MPIQLEIEETGLTHKGQLSQLCRQHTYQVRIDGYDNDTNRELLDKFTKYLGKKYESPTYLFCPEIGEKTSKPHYQGLITFKEKELKANDLNCIRNWLKRNVDVDIDYDKIFYKDKKKIQRVSFTKARDALNLYSYTTKSAALAAEIDNWFASLCSNVSVEIIKVIPKWDAQDKPSSQLIWKRCLNAIKAFKGKNNHENWNPNNWEEKKFNDYYRQESIKIIIEEHLKVDKIPHKNTILKLLFKNEQLDSTGIAFQIGLGTYFRDYERDRAENGEYY